MELSCSVIGENLEITETCIPVISPYWRLKRSGDLLLLWNYHPDLSKYTILSPQIGAVLSLFNGKLSLRHIALIIQYIFNLDNFDSAWKFLLHSINEVNKTCDAIVNMADSLIPYIQTYDTFSFIADLPKETKQRRLAYPVSLTVMFSNSCETNCVYCYANRRIVSASEQLSTERWIEIFREAQSMGIEQVSLTGGDPLFRKDSITLIGELIKLKMLFLISTKCHITRDKADQLVAVGMTEPINQFTREVQISMDGPDADTVDKLAGSIGYFDRAIDSITNLVERGFNLRVKAVLIPYNAPRVYEWIKLMAGLGVRRLFITAYNRSVYRHADTLFLSLEDRELIEQQYERAKRDFPEVELRTSGLDNVKRLQEAFTGARDKSDSEKMEEWKKRTHCSGGRSNIVITPDGKVVLCETVPQDGIFVVGDLTTQSIIEVWNSQKLLDFAYPSRNKFKGSACYDCDYLNDCLSSLAGYCFRNLYFNYGNVFERPPQCPFSPDHGMRME